MELNNGRILMVDILALGHVKHAVKLMILLLINAAAADEKEPDVYAAAPGIMYVKAAAFG